MNERTIFVGALERPAGVDRLAYLTDACGNDVALRAHVDALLREHEQLGGFLESAASELKALQVHAARPILTELGDYRILREIGRGGMGIVYEAEQGSLGRHVALKVLPTYSLLEASRLQRFQREAKAAARLHHTNIVPIYGVGEHAGLHYFVMQFIVGHSLDQILRALQKQQDPVALDPKSVQVSAAQQTLHNSQPVAAHASRTLACWPCPSLAAYHEHVARVGLHVAQALDYAAQQGVLHRDIKPANVMLDEAGQVWVMDFGLAKLADSDDLTDSEELIGTLRYMAPERFQNRFDARSDVYSLGLTLYELLTLRPAYVEVDRRQLVARVVSTAPPRPRQVNRAIPRDLETIVLKAIAREPQARYGTAGELAEDLGRFLDGRPIQARRSSAAERLWRRCRRNPAWAALTASVVVLGLAIIVISFLSALWLGERATQAEVAEHKVEEQLWVSKRDQAGLMRMSRRPGQRIESLRLISELTELPVPPGHSIAELRTEAIAAFAIPDIEVLRTWQAGLTPGIVRVALDRNLQYCARLAENGAVTVIRVSDNHQIASWHEDSEQVWRTDESRLCFSEDGQCLYVWQYRLQRLAVRRCATGESVLKSPCMDASDPEAICFTPDNSVLAYVAADSRIAVIDLASGLRRYLPPTGMRRTSMQCSPDSCRVAIAGIREGELTVEIRDLATGTCQRTLTPHLDLNKVWLEWHPDGNTLAIADDDRASDYHRIRLWDVAQNKVIRTFEGHRNWGIRCSFDATGSRLLSNDWGAVLRLWEPSSGQKLLSFPSAGYDLLQVSKDGRLVATPVEDTTKLLFLRLHGNQEYRNLAVDPAKPGKVKVHGDGRIVAVGTRGSVLLIDLETGREIGKLPTADSPLLWDSTGALLTIGSSGLLRWPLRVDSRNPEHYTLGPPRRLLVEGSREQCGVSNDARIIAIPRLDDGAVVINDGGRLEKKRLVGQQDVRHCTVSPNGEWVATGSHNCSGEFGVRVWQASSGQEVARLRVPGMCTPTFSPDGRWLLTNAGGCQLWRVGTWTGGPKIGGARGCFSPEGRLLAVEGTPGTVRLVESDTGTEVVRLESPEQSRMLPQCFTPNGTRLIVWGHDTGLLHVWDLQLIRHELGQLKLDWAVPPYPPARTIAPTHSLEIEVLPGDLAWETAFESPAAAQQTAGLDTFFLALNPFNYQAHWQRACANCCLGNSSQSVADYSMFLQLAPSDSPHIADALRARADHCRCLQKDAEAIDDLKRLVARQPGSAQDDFFLAWMFATGPQDLRDPAGSLLLARRAVALAPENGCYWNALGAARYRNRDWDGAIEGLAKSRELSHSQLDGFNTFFLAMAHWQKGEKDCARQWFDRGVAWMESSKQPIPRGAPFLIEELRRIRTEAAELLELQRPSN